MDIGNQQRVIIVELDTADDPAPLIAVEAEMADDLGPAAEWPLPLELDPEPVS